jgi:hypothetical protein
MVITSDGGFRNKTIDKEIVDEALQGQMSQVPNLVMMLGRTPARNRY